MPATRRAACHRHPAGTDSRLTTGSTLAPGSGTWRLHSALAREEGDPVIRKTAADAFCRTSLKATPDALSVDAHAGKDRPHIGGAALIKHCNWLWAHLDAPGAPLRVLLLAGLAGTLSVHAPTK